jgi:cysteinyl-tRNA synthetase
VDLRAVGVAVGILQNTPAAYLAERRARLVKRKGIDVADVERRLGERSAARAAKDFARADAVRAELLATGVELLDTPTGTDWRVQDDAG